MRGRVTFSAGGVEHCLQFTTNRLCDLEAQSDRKVIDFAEALGQPGGLSFIDIRLLMQIGLGMGAGDAQVLGAPSGKENAGDIIDEIGLPKALTLISQAFAAAFGVDETKAAVAGAKTAGKRMASAA